MAERYRRGGWLAALLLLLPLAVEAQVRVHDDLGHEVVLAQPASRVVSLAPHITELLFAVGAGEVIVGTASHSDWPPQALELPVVSHQGRPDLERIVALQPDLVIVWESGNGPRTRERLQALGLTVYASEPRRLEQIATSLARFGALTDRAQAGAEAAAAFRDGLQALKADHAGRAPVRLFYQIWHQPLMTVGGDHIINEVVALCGGVNVFAELRPLAPTVDTEAVLAADPDVIIASGLGEPDPAWVEGWLRWPQLRAVRHARLFTLDPDLLQRSTPRLLEGARQLCAALDSARS